MATGDQALDDQAMAVETVAVLEDAYVDYEGGDNTTVRFLLSCIQIGKCVCLHLVRAASYGANGAAEI